MKFVMSSAIAAIIALGSIHPAFGCENDTDCKGSRVCEKQSCVDVPSYATAPSVRASIIASDKISVVTVRQSTPAMIGGIVLTSFGLQMMLTGAVLMALDANDCGSRPQGLSGACAVGTGMLGGGGFLSLLVGVPLWVVGAKKVPAPKALPTVSFNGKHGAIIWNF